MVKKDFILKKILLVLTVFLCVSSNVLFAQNEEIYEQEEVAELTKIEELEELEIAINRQHIYDEAFLFTDDEKVKIEESIKNFVNNSFSIAKEYIELVIVTTNDASGKTSAKYADDFYDENDFGIGQEKSGALLLIDMDNRECYISTNGKMIDYLTDRRIDETLDNLVPCLQQKNYYKCAELFVTDVTKNILYGIPDNQKRISVEVTEPKIRSFTLKKILIAIGLGFIVALISCLVVIKSYSFKNPKYDYPFQNEATLDITKKVDTLIGKNITTQHIERNSSSGGGSSISSTHSSSSGRTHGGGGRKF